MLGRAGGTESVGWVTALARCPALDDAAVDNGGSSVASSDHTLSITGSELNRAQRNSVLSAASLTIKHVGKKQRMTRGES